MIKILSLALGLLFSTLTFAQFNNKETNIWYFGNNAGLDFNTSPPTILTNGALSTIEGCATVCDANGTLLFYTDGITVYNASHTVMPNGSGLQGNSSSSQSAIIAKKPGTNGVYYIFTNSGPYGMGMGYSIVDMNLASGQGSVTTKNFTLETSSTEKLTSVKHCNGIDTWIIMHKWNSNEFNAYLLTSAGVNSVAVTSTIGTAHANSTAFAGCMKTSPNGKRLGLAIYNIGNFELFDFDNTTGIISNSIVLATGITTAYGCEFSPDGTKFYGSNGIAPGNLYQWDLCAGSPSAIVNSSVTIYTSTAGIAAMQNAADGKIYIARYNQSHLGVIQSPNSLGTACNYNDVGQSILPKMTIWSIPNFICNFKTNVPAYTYTLACNSASFTAPVIQSTTGCSASSTVTQVKWNFGDPNSSNNTSTLSTPVHIYNTPGTYTAQYIVNYDCGTPDTVKQNIVITGLAPSLSVTGVFTVCPNEKRTYTVSGADSYTWTSLNQTPTLQVTTPSSSTTLVYTVNGTHTVSGCVTSKTFSVYVRKCTDIQDLEWKASTQIYPMPLKDELNIDAAQSLKLSVVDITGKIYCNQNIEPGHHSIETAEWPQGLYIITLSNGLNVAHYKVFKQNN